MTQLRWMTAGESHGPELVALIEGIPAGLPLVAADVDADLARRQKGYGRGGRMKIETDRVQFVAGVRNGETLGSPIAMVVVNRDPTPYDELAVEVIREPIGVALPKICAAISENRRTASGAAGHPPTMPR